MTIAESEKYRRALQLVMQILGPRLPGGVDYTAPQNVDLLLEEHRAALRVIKDAGIVYRQVEYTKPRRTNGRTRIPTEV